MTEQRNQLADLFAACWKDEALKQRFMADPKAVLAEYGMDVPDGMAVNIVENTEIPCAREDNARARRESKARIRVAHAAWRLTSTMNLPPSERGLVSSPCRFPPLLSIARKTA